MKLILVEQMQKFHQNVKDNLEDESIDIRKIAPMGPDFDIWESQLSDVKKEIAI